MDRLHKMAERESSVARDEAIEEPARNHAALEGQARELNAVQAKGALDGSDVQASAAKGVAGVGQALPHLGAIQASFGKHDVSGVQAHVGGAAADAANELGAQAYATGNQVAFSESPDLHTAAHEAAHVVQQRGGVQLKGGIGQSGDRYEQHADAVADLVVQGKSAEGLLDQHAGGTDAQVGDAVQREDPKDDKALDTVLELILENYQYQSSLRLKAIEEVEEDAKEKPSAKLDTMILSAVAEIALSAAAAGVGRIITDKLVKAGKFVAKASQDAVNKAIQESIKATTKGAVSAKAKGPTAALKGFFRGQWDSMAAQDHAVRKQFISAVKPSMKEAPDGLEQAKALNASLEAASKEVKELQRRATIENWLSYMARSEYGEQHGGAKIADAKDTSQKGVLGLRFKAGYSSEPIKIIDAEMDGVGDDFAATIASIPIGKLKIPITAHGEVRYGHNWGTAAFGRNEGSGLWDKSDYFGLMWLHGKAGHGAELWNNPRNTPSLEHVREARWDGIKNIFKHELEGETLSSLGVKITTEGGTFD